MPAFVFIGDQTQSEKHPLGEGPETLHAYGFEFQKNGAPVEVTAPAIIEKLAGNSHFIAHTATPIDVLEVANGDDNASGTAQPDFNTFGSPGRRRRGAL